MKESGLSAITDRAITEQGCGSCKHFIDFAPLDRFTGACSKRAGAEGDGSQYIGPRVNVMSTCGEVELVRGLWVWQPEGEGR